PVDDFRYVGAAAGAAEGGSLPYAAGDELERTGLDLLAGASNADDDRDSPAAMTALERLTHQVHTTDAFEAVVGAAVGERDEVLHQVTPHFLRIHEVRHPKFFRQRLAPRIDVHADDLVGTHQTGALDHVQPDAT